MEIHGDKKQLPVPTEIAARGLPSMETALTQNKLEKNRA
jgi:hypothetical protein